MKRDGISASEHVSCDTSSPLYAAVCILDDLYSPHQLRTHLIDGPFLNKTTYKDQYLIHWNINIRKRKNK